MISFQQREVICNTHGGTITHLIMNQKNYLALRLNSLNQVVENNFFKGELIDQYFDKLLNFRKYEEQIRDPYDQKTTLYLFSWKEGILMSNKIDIIANLEKKYFSETKIQKYLTQLLESLYQLHQKRILGRVFSTSNILVDKDDNITILDFGFGPEISVDGQLMLAPPEIIEKLLQKKSIIEDCQISYDIKIDSWLIGTLLYHLIKLTPLTQQIYPNYQQYSNELNNLKLNQIKHKQVETGKLYTSSLLDLTQKLLYFDPANRLDFLQIFQHQYIRSMELPHQSEYISFYEKIQNDKDYFAYNINIREQPKNQMIDTGQLQAPSDIVTPKSQPFSPLIEQNFDYSYDQYLNSKYCEIWKKIQLEQYKCFLLKYTVDNLIKRPYENVLMRNLVSYGLLKMSIIIRKELLACLVVDQPPHQVNKALWDEFKTNDKQKLLIMALELAQESQHEKLIKIHKEIYEQSNENQSKIGKFLEELQQDELKQFNFQNDSSLNINSYRKYTTLFIQLVDSPPNKETIKLQLLAIFCHCINRLTEYDNLKKQFIQIEPQGDQITLNEIHQFIEGSEQNINQTVKQINFLKKQFQK